MDHRRLDDADRRAADGVVASCERRPASRRVVRDDHGGRDDGYERPGREDDGARAPPAVRERVPDAEHRDDEADLLLRQAGRAGAQRERQQPVLVEKPDRTERAAASRARPGGSRRRRATASVGRGGTRARSRGRTSSAPRCLRASRKTGTAPSATPTACTTRSRSGLGHSHQTGARSATSGSKCAPRREICAPGGRSSRGTGRAPSTRRPGSGCRRRTGRSRSASLLEHRERRHPGGERGHRDREKRARPGHALAIARSSRRASARRAPLRSREPRTSPGRRRRTRPRARARWPAAARRRRARPDRRAARGGRRRPSVSSSRAAGVSAVTSGVAHAIAWNALLGITRAAFALVPKMPRTQPAAWISFGRSSYSTQGPTPRSPADRRGGARVGRLPTTRNGTSGAIAAAARMVSSPCSGISLPTKSA